jgi:hypothetical protein
MIQNLTEARPETARSEFSADQFEAARAAYSANSALVDVIGKLSDEERDEAIASAIGAIETLRNMRTNGKGHIPSGYWGVNASNIAAMMLKSAPTRAEVVKLFKLPKPKK